MLRPLLSVQVPVRNPGAGMSLFLGSLAGQAGLDFEWELVLADDGSDPPVSGRFDLETCGAGRVRVVRLEGEGNRPAARNAALEASEGPVSLLADADLRFAPDVLKAHADAHRAGRADVFRGARINAWSPRATPWQKWFDTRAGNLAPAGPMPWRHLVTGNVSIRTKLLVESGGMDPSIVTYGGEDTELGYRLFRMGASFYRDPAVRAYHLDEVTVRRHSEKMAEYGAGGLRKFLEAHPEAGGLLGSRWMEPVLAEPVAMAPVRLAVRLALLRPLYRFVLAWMEKAGRPRFLFTYLSVGAVLRGLSGRGV